MDKENNIINIPSDQDKEIAKNEINDISIIFMFLQYTFLQFVWAGIMFFCVYSLTKDTNDLFMLLINH